MHAPADAEQLEPGPGGLRALLRVGHHRSSRPRPDGRACHAMELDPAYVDVAVLRWQAFTGQEAMLDGDGRTFAEIAAARATGAECEA